MDSVYKGELVPISVKVEPSDPMYSELTINSDTTRAEIKDSKGTTLTTHGDLLIDATSKTVMFSWDTSAYEIGTYVLTLWVGITYQETEFLLKSNSVSRVIKQTSL